MNEKFPIFPIIPTFYQDQMRPAPATKPSYGQLSIGNASATDSTGISDRYPPHKFPYAIHMS